MSVPAALTYLYTSRSEIDDLLSEYGVDLRLDDNDSNSIDTTESARLTTNGLNIATAKCNLYLLERYDASDLYESWIVHHWATVIAARWLCKRRGNPVPESLDDEYDEVIEEMTAVKEGDMSLGDVAQRESDQPTFSNVTMVDHYALRKIRVQRPISEQSPSAIPQNRHYPSDYLVEP